MVVRASNSCCFFFIAEFSKIGRKHVLCISRNTHGKFQELEKAGKNSFLLALVPTAFLILLNFHLCFYIHVYYIYELEIFTSLVNYHAWESRESNNWFSINLMLFTDTLKMQMSGNRIDSENHSQSGNAICDRTQVDLY